MMNFVLFIVFLKIGAFTFGGGYAMLPLIQEEVIKHGWLTQEALINFIAVSESTPGPFAVNIATYIGMETAGLSGAFFATLGVVLPSFAVILIAANFFEKFKNSIPVKGLMSGLKPAAAGLILSAVVSIGQTVFMPGGFSFGIFNNAEFYISLGIFICMTVMAFRGKHPIMIILLSAAAGIISGYLFGL